MGGKPAMFEEFETSRKLRTRDIEKAQVSCRKLHNFRISRMKSHEMIVCAESCSNYIGRNYQLHVMSRDFPFV